MGFNIIQKQPIFLCTLRLDHSSEAIHVVSFNFRIQVSFFQRTRLRFGKRCPNRIKNIGFVSCGLIEVTYLVLPAIVACLEALGILFMPPACDRHSVSVLNGSVKGLFRDMCPARSYSLRLSRLVEPKGFAVQVLSQNHRRQSHFAHSSQVISTSLKGLCKGSLQDRCLRDRRVMVQIDLQPWGSKE